MYRGRLRGSPPEAISVHPHSSDPAVFMGPGCLHGTRPCPRLSQTVFIRFRPCTIIPASRDGKIYPSLTHHSYSYGIWSRQNPCPSAFVGRPFDSAAFVGFIMIHHETPTRYNKYCCIRLPHHISTTPNHEGGQGLGFPSRCVRVTVLSIRGAR